MDRYAFLLAAMSMSEAKEKLGFPPDSDPSPREIKEAYRQKALKLHPDVGGTDREMEEVNVAKDILEGKARPSYDRRDTPVRKWEPPKKTEVTFDQAESRAGIPGGVEWFFVTPRQYGPRWSSDESSQGDSNFVAYGRTDREHVFVAARHYTRHDYFIGGTHDENIWTVKSIEIPIKKDEGVQPRWLYGNVVKALKALGFKGRFNSKVLDAKGWRLGEREPSGSPTSIKHWLVNSGQVSGTDPSVAGRKQTVQLEIGGSYDKPELDLILNGRAYTLSDRDYDKFNRARFGGQELLRLIFGRYHYRGSKKMLTRIRNGKKIIGWLVEYMKDLPEDAVEILKAAEAQMR